MWPADRERPKRWSGVSEKIASRLMRKPERLSNWSSTERVENQDVAQEICIDPYVRCNALQYQEYPDPLLFQLSTRCLHSLSTALLLRSSTTVDYATNKIKPNRAKPCCQRRHRSQRKPWTFQKYWILNKLLFWQRRNLINFTVVVLLVLITCSFVSISTLMLIRHAWPAKEWDEDESA
jgi:hypothetical protein